MSTKTCTFNKVGYKKQSFEVCCGIITISVLFNFPGKGGGSTTFLWRKNSTKKIFFFPFLASFFNIKMKSRIVIACLALLVSSSSAFKFKDEEITPQEEVKEVDAAAVNFGETSEGETTATREDRKIETAPASVAEEKPEEEKVQGRFFDIQSKLCALGLSDVSTDLKQKTLCW